MGSCRIPLRIQLCSGDDFRVWTLDEGVRVRDGVVHELGKKLAVVLEGDGEGFGVGLVVGVGDLQDDHVLPQIFGQLGDGHVLVVRQGAGWSYPAPSR